MDRHMIIDTDVLLCYMRGDLNAKTTINKFNTFSISAVSYMELLQGIRNKNELNNLQNFLQNRTIRCINIDQDITSRAIYLMEIYSLSHGLRMEDALIASTVDIAGETLLTGNFSRYRMIPSLSIKKFKPKNP